MENVTTLNLIQEMRGRISDDKLDDYYCSDGYLDRWIRYQSCNVDAAVTAFEKMLGTFAFDSIVLHYYSNLAFKWRRENMIPELQEEDYADLDERFPVELYPVPDKYGRPVVTITLETWNCKNMTFYEYHYNRYKRAMLKLAERVEDWIRQHSEKSPGVSSQCVVVLDCTKLADHILDVGVKNIVMVARLLKEMMHAMSVIYPRICGAIYVINASKWFKFFLKAVKPFMSKDTMNVLQIHGSNSDFDWKSQVF